MCYPTWTQRYIESHPLLGNPSSLVGIGVEKNLSVVGSPLAFGVYARIDIDAGAMITNYGGFRQYASRMRCGDVVATHTINCADGSGDILDGAPSRMALATFTPSTIGELDWASTLPLDTFAFDPTLLSSSIGPVLRSGIGYMCNTAARKRDNNAKYDTVRVRVAGGMEHALKIVRARRRIKAGEQIMCAYNTQQMLQLDELM